MSATYVSRIYIYLPPQRRYEPSLRKSFNPYALHSSGNPYLTIETFDWLGRIEETTLRLSELKEFKNNNLDSLFPSKQLRVFVSINPALENNLSEGTEVPIIGRYFKTISLKI